MHFVDASALVKRYVRETHSARVRRLLAGGPIAVSRLSEVEVPSALARLVREGRLTERGRDRALVAFAGDLVSWHVVELTAAVVALARDQVVRHDLRAGDAIQLASALWLQDATHEPLAGMMAYDVRLLEASHAAGIAIVGGWRHRGPRRTSSIRPG